jgi:methyltransferase (TIGR00027 family)
MLEQAATSIHERFSLGMRAWLVARSRYAEDKLAQAVIKGIRQYVLLGAGLDTFAHRNPHPSVRVFEVDHPATQQWKRNLLALSGLPEPSNLRYVPIDFERQSFTYEMQSSGLDLGAPIIFAWLGVVMYLSHSAFRATLDFIAALPTGSGVIMDYGLPRHALPPSELESRNLLAARVESIGEPFQLFFTPEQMAAELTAFQLVEDLDPEEINARYFFLRTDQLSLVGWGGHLTSAWR